MRAHSSTTDFVSMLRPSWARPGATLLEFAVVAPITFFLILASIVRQNMPTYLDTDPTLVPPGQKSVQNYVTITVTYQWLPELILVGPINLTSTSTVAMSY